ncbi:MAG: hypothetical protein ACTSRG_12995 [Candidatus Helarchaeota archaeon]
MANPLIAGGMALITSGINLAETILKRKTPGEAKRLGELKLELIDINRIIEEEESKEDPHDKLIQKLYKDEGDLHAKINIYMDLADSQQRSIDS